MTYDEYKKCRAIHCPDCAAEKPIVSFMDEWHVEPKSPSGFVKCAALSRDDFEARQAARIAELEEEVAEQEASFNLRWSADMRAIKRWQESTGRKLVWPDHVDLCVWLMAMIAKLEDTIDADMAKEPK